MKITVTIEADVDDDTLRDATRLLNEGRSISGQYAGAPTVRIVKHEHTIPAPGDRPPSGLGGVRHDPTRGIDPTDALHGPPTLPPRKVTHSDLPVGPVKYVALKAWAKEHHVPYEHASAMCRNGIIGGARRKATGWQVPHDTPAATIQSRTT